jgi:glycosyltransferase involved in cell wall biosynthesis
MISVVVNYCTNDERFIRTSLDNLLKVSDDIIVPISDHFYDGSPEDFQSIDKLVAEYPTVRFKLYKWEIGKKPRYWHNFSRYLGTSLCKHKWILYLDSDEIIEPDLFKKFLDNGIEDYDTYKLACYWYFREPIYQSIEWEDTPVLVRKDLVYIDLYAEMAERDQMYIIHNAKKMKMVTLYGKPFIHHFSWVRTKEAMLKKVKTWGHCDDKDWESAINEEFSRPFNNTDFVHGYTYTIVDNQFNI